MAQSIDVASRMMTKDTMTARNFIWSYRCPNGAPQRAQQKPPVSYRQVWHSLFSDQHRFRRTDVDSTNGRRTRTTSTMPGRSGLTTATRTTTTSRKSSVWRLSADQNDAGNIELQFRDLVQAYHDCRRTKRNTPSALAFEQNLERNLIQLFDELLDGTYNPGKSICFVVTKPKPREVWAAEFRDRIVHHLLYNKISPWFYARFVADSCACIPGRGTLYGANRLESKIRSITENWSKPAYYLKCDLANFFVSIDKQVLQTLLERGISDPYWLSLAMKILWHDPRLNFEFRGHKSSICLVPQHKQLANQSSNRGLPIGNLPSQFFANVYLNELDQFAKHQLRAKHYIRYVDDIVILDKSTDFLNDALNKIEKWLPENLGVKLNPSKTILQPVERGVDFVGHVIKPWRVNSRKRTVRQAFEKIRVANDNDFFTLANSYFGLFGQSSSSHQDRADLAKICLARGYSVNRALTKIYRKKP